MCEPGSENPVNRKGYRELGSGNLEPLLEPVSASFYTLSRDIKPKSNFKRQVLTNTTATNFGSSFDMSH